MKNQTQTVSYSDLKGSEQHLPLKDQPGQNGDKDHASSEEKLDEDAAKIVKKSNAKTQIADGLRDLVEEDKSDGG